MSLTRDEWCKLWECAKSLELDVKIVKSFGHDRLAKVMQKHVDEIKEKIQEVIGQME